MGNGNSCAALAVKFRPRAMGMPLTLWILINLQATSMGELLELELKSCLGLVPFGWL